MTKLRDIDVLKIFERVRPIREIKRLHGSEVAKEVFDFDYTRCEANILENKYADNPKQFWDDIVELHRTTIMCYGRRTSCSYVSVKTLRWIKQNHAKYPSVSVVTKKKS